MVIFYSYVSLPKGSPVPPEISQPLLPRCRLWTLSRFQATMQDVDGNVFQACPIREIMQDIKKYLAHIEVIYC